MDLFKELLPSLTHQKNYLFDGANDEAQEKAYNAYMTNRALSMYEDTVLLANEMNCNSHLDPKLQYDFYFHAIPKKKRFSKWAKGGKNDVINLIKETYSVSFKKAEEISGMLSDSEIEQIKNYMDRGGKP